MKIEFKGKEYERTDKPFTPENIILAAVGCPDARVKVGEFIKAFGLEMIFTFNQTINLNIGTLKIEWLTPYTPWLVEHGFWRECEVEYKVGQWFKEEGDGSLLQIVERKFRKVGLVHIEGNVINYCSAPYHNDTIDGLNETIKISGTGLIPIPPPIITDTSNLTAEGCAHYHGDSPSSCGRKPHYYNSCVRHSFEHNCEHYAITIGTPSDD